MNFKPYISLVSVFLYTAILSTSCSDDLMKSGEIEGKAGNILQVEVEFADYAPHTRLGINKDDGWTYSRSSFQAGDKMGMFSRAGNQNVENGYGPLINIPMTCMLVKTEDGASGQETNSYTFQNEDGINIYTQAMRYNGVFMYYPYFDEMGSEADYRWQNANTQNYKTMYTRPGVPLRYKMEDDTWRCRDMLQMASVNEADLKKGILKGSIYHTFAEIGIVRGYGFDNPPPGQDQIYVVMTQPYTHVRIVSNTNTVGWWLQMVTYDDLEKESPAGSSETYAEIYSRETGLSKNDCFKWECWKGGLPSGTEPPEDGPIPQYYYAVVPTTSYGLSTTNLNYRSTVQEIYLADNDGNWQHVTSFFLNDNSPNEPSSNKGNKSDIPDKYPRYFNRYFLEIKMSELGPTVSPVDIKDWEYDEENNDITEVREYGINDPGEYISWANAYNGYKRTSGTDQETYRQQLYQYGDYDITNNVWHFYIKRNIDFIPGDVDLTPPQIIQFDDILEGENKFTNLTISGIDIKQPLFGTISGKGAIKYLTFSGITVRSQSTDAIGCLAANVVGGIQTGSGINTSAPGWFSHVNIENAYVSGKGPVGMLAGTMSEGWIDNCYLSGFMMGSSTSGWEIEGDETTDPGDLPPMPATYHIIGVTPTNMPVVSQTDATNASFSKLN